MDQVVKDRVFGEMEYKHGWMKMQEVLLHGKSRDIKIVASAYTGERICEEQRLGYCYFCDNLSKISDQSEELLIDYVQSHGDDIYVRYPACKNLKKENISEFVVPRTVLFDRNGLVVLLYDVIWDTDDGVGVEIYPNTRIGLQDEFL